MSIKPFFLEVVLQELEVEVLVQPPPPLQSSQGSSQPIVRVSSVSMSVVSSRRGVEVPEVVALVSLVVVVVEDD